jgi:hypothetical protein
MRLVGIRWQRANCKVVISEMGSSGKGTRDLQAILRSGGQLILSNNLVAPLSAMVAVDCRESLK